MKNNEPNLNLKWTQLKVVSWTLHNDLRLRMITGNLFGKWAAHCESESERKRRRKKRDRLKLGVIQDDGDFIGI